MAQDSQHSSSAASPAEHDPLPTVGALPYFSRFIHDETPIQPPDWLSDIELINHYTAVACRTITESEGPLRVLQYDMPREGLSHTFLLKQILAFAAFHLAYLHPEHRRKYQLLASQHQDVALKGIMAGLASTLTSSNCHALYASSLLLTMSAFATYPRCDADFLSFEPLDSLVDIFVLISGMATVLSSSRSDLKDGPLKDMIGRRPGPPKSEDYLHTIVDELSKLRRWVERRFPDLEDEIASITAEAITSLADSVSTIQSQHSADAAPGLRIIFLWPILMPAKYLRLVRQREPISLAILAHYCVILRSTEANYWFLEGWAKAVIDEVASSLSGFVHEEIIRWPVSMSNSLN